MAFLVLWRSFFPQWGLRAGDNTLDAYLLIVKIMAVFRFRERSVVVDQYRRLLAALKASDAETACEVLSEQMDYLADGFAAAQAG